jgi:hypothetical protein
VARVLPLLGTAACPLGGGGGDDTGDSDALGRCLWVAGAVPVHTFFLDPFGFAWLADWAYSTPVAQNGRAASAFGLQPNLWGFSLPFRATFAYHQLQYCSCANLSGTCNATNVPAPEGPASLNI